MKYTPVLICLLFSLHLSAQKQDTEFPKEFIMHFKLHNGMITNGKGYAPDIYVGGIQVIPQYTIVPKLLRGGVILDGFYSGKKIQGAVGPTVSIKLKSFYVQPFGTAGNLHLSIDHLWGTDKQKLIGGGLNADVANKIVVGISVHRDYYTNTWWIQNCVGLRLSKVKKVKEPFN